MELNQQGALVVASDSNSINENRQGRVRSQIMIKLWIPLKHALQVFTSVVADYQIGAVGDQNLREKNRKEMQTFTSLTCPFLAAMWSAVSPVSSCKSNETWKR